MHSVNVYTYTFFENFNTLKIKFSNEIAAYVHFRNALDDLHSIIKNTLFFANKNVNIICSGSPRHSMLSNFFDNINNFLYNTY